MGTRRLRSGAPTAACTRRPRSCPTGSKVRPPAEKVTRGTPAEGSHTQAAASAGLKLATLLTDQSGRRSGRSPAARCRSNAAGCHAPPSVQKPPAGIETPRRPAAHFTPALAWPLSPPQLPAACSSW
jgi:hypothetical protein